MAALLSLRDIGFRYGTRRVLAALDLRISEAEVIGILGQNGSGKSTLLKLMAGILRPTCGEIRLRGLSLDALDRRTLAREIAWVPQGGDLGFPSFRVWELVLMGRFPHQRWPRIEGKRDRAVAWKALELTQCADLAERRVQELSGGERQRVLIARALAQEPRILLLDEPTAALDLKFKGAIFRLIAHLARTQGVAVVVVTHEIDLLARYASRLLLLREGRDLAAGTPEAVLTEANLESAFGCSLQVDRNPRTGRLLISLP